MKFLKNLRQHFVIFSLVLMLGLISYVNYNINQSALLETSKEFEAYELTMLENEELSLEPSIEIEEPVMNEVDGLEENKINLVEEKIEESLAANDEIDADKLADLVESSDNEISKAVTSKNLMQSSSYFIEGKLERDKKRSELVRNLDDIINGQNTNDDTKDQATSMKLKTITNTEKEVFIENMIMAKGFEDVIVYLSENSINVVVSSENLGANDVAKIVDIVKRETNISMDNIIIMSKK